MTDLVGGLICQDVANGGITDLGQQLAELGVNPSQSLRRLHQRPPDISVMDIQMPVLGGCEVTREIEDLPDVYKMPVIAVSSLAMEGDEEKARAAGCDAYVTKPYSPKTADRPRPSVSRRLLTSLLRSQHLAVQVQANDVEDVLADINAYRRKLEFWRGSA